MRSFIAIAVLILLLGSAHATPVGTGFTFQGELKQQGAPASGGFDFQFELFTVDVDGTTIANTIMLEGVAVDDGVFTVELDFGSAASSGEQLWLEISVREDASVGDYTLLAPRQKITAVPYALQAEAIADGAVTAAKLDLFGTIHVEASGTDTENCTALRAVLSGITGGDPTLVVLGPGIYDCGATFVTVPPFVVLQGAGIDVTTLRGSGGNSSTGFIDLNNGSEIRFVTAIADVRPGQTFNPAVGARSASFEPDGDISARVSHSKILQIAGCTSSNCGNAVVVSFEDDTVRLTIDNSYVEGSRHAMLCSSFGGTGVPEHVILASQLVSASSEGLVSPFCPSSGPGTPVCVNSYDVNFDPVAKNCTAIP